MKELIDKLLAVQDELNAPKSQYNKFGNYYYRSCEDILTGAKPLLVKAGLLQTISDEVVLIGDRYYVQATVTVQDGKNSISNSALARESETRPKFDGSQLTGSASSYARKYALNGMYAIDDTKDADTDEHTNQQANAPQKQASPDIDKPWYDGFELDKESMLVKIRNGESSVEKILNYLTKNFKVSTETRDKIKELK